jgi:methylmalonyl-CoA mutase
MPVREVPREGESPEIERWRARVRQTLSGGDLSALDAVSRDGIVIQPLYAAQRDAAPFPGRGARPWTVVENIDQADPDEANEQALSALAGGATGLALYLEGAPSAPGPGLPAEQEALHIALQDVDLSAVHLRIEPNPAGVRVGRWLKEIVDSSGVAAELTTISFGLDPVAAFVCGGTADAVGAAGFSDLFRELATTHFFGPFGTLDGRLYHEAGGTEAQELAGVLASAAWWVRVLDDSGLDPSGCLPLLGATVAVDQNLLLSIAKLRAARLVWARLQDVCRSSRGPLPIHVETSRRMLSGADVETNLLRNAIAAFAAGVGGADSVAVLPHTSARRPDADARAVARNLQHLLIEEAHLHRVEDPAAGSGAIETLSQSLAERAWSEFQAIEQEGGIISSLAAGAFQARIADARVLLQGQVARREMALVGATPDLAPAAAAAPPPAKNTPLTVSGLTPVRLEDFLQAG